MGTFTQGGVKYEELPDGKVRVVGYEQAPAAATSLPGAFVPARPKPKEAPSGFRYTPNGNLEKIPGGPADTPEKPNLPTGYRIGANGVAERIPGLPVEDASEPVDPAVTAAIKDLGLDELLAAVAAARREIGTGKATGIRGAVGRMIPGSTANDFSGSLDAIQGGIIMEKLQQLKDASKTGASGMGALSEREGARLAASVAALGPNMSADKLLEGLSIIERHAHALKAVADGKNPDDPAVAKQYGVVAAKPAEERKAAGGAIGGTGGGGGSDGPDDSDLSLSKGGTETVTDPALSGANEHIKSMIRAGRSSGEIRAYLETVRPGLGSKVNNLEAWIDYHNAHPSEPINARIDRVERPLTPVGSFLNRAAQSMPGALALGAADMLSGGTLDNMTGNPALARAGMAGVAQEHPNATLAGNVLGGIGMGMGAEGLAGLALGARGALLAGDILPGVAYGAGSSDEGSRLGGAALGGLAGVVGGVGGRALGRGVSGIIDPAVKRLNDAGIRMTLPQMLGGGYKGLEDRLSGLAGFRGIINGARARGIEDANAATFAQAVVPPGAAITGDQIGEAGVNNLADAVSRAYKDALGGRAVQIDPQFTTDWGSLSQQLPNIPRVGPELQASIAQTVGPMFDQTGKLSGESMQAIDRGLNDLRGAYADDPLYATHIKPAIDAADEAVSGMFARQAPEVMPAYNAAKQSYRNLSTISDAVNSGINTNGVFTAAQLGTAARNNAKKYGSKIGAAKGERPFFQLQRDMQNVLPSKIPDPGTAGQLMLPGALALVGGGGGAFANREDGVGGAAKGAGAGALLGLGGAAALASPFVLRPVLQKALTAPRPTWAQISGEILGKSRLPGSLALPLLLPGGP